MLSRGHVADKTDAMEEELAVWVEGERVSDAELTQWELQFARRALVLLKELITEREMKALLAPLLARSKKQFEEWIAASDGKLRSILVDIEIAGLTSAQFIAWFQANSGGTAMLAAHPEHYFFGETDLIETMGWYPVHLIMEPLAEPPAPVDPDYPQRVIAAGRVAGSSEPAGAVMHQFRDVPGGCRAKLGCYFPAAAPDDFIAIHRQHVAVEFSNWLVAARESG
jgi:hypothetical protein